jgi:hypothetical protein
VGGGGATPAPAPNPGRAPGAPERVGWGPRRSPGRTGGRVWPCGGTPGRGRWKMGLPRSGIPPRGGALVPARGATDGGARYTGRGPVWGTIKRRGVCAAVPGCPGRASPARPIPWPSCPGTAGRVAPARFSAADGASSSAAGTSPSAVVGISDSIIADVNGTASLSSSAVIWSSITGSEGGAGGFAGGAATGGFGGITMAAGGRATD